MALSQPARNAYVWMIFASISVGYVSIIVKKVGMSSVTLVSGRCLIASLALFAFAKARHKKALDKMRIRQTVIAGLLLAAHWTTFFLALRFTTVAIALVSLFTFPSMMALAEPLSQKERPSIRQLFAALLIVAGVGLLAEWRNPSPGVLAGIAVALLSALLFTVRNLITKSLMRSEDSMVVMAWQTMIASVVLAPLIPFYEHDFAGMQSLAWLVLLGIVFTALPHTLRIYSMKHLPVATIDIISAIAVPASALLAWAHLNEMPTLRTIAGAALVLSAIIVESLDKLTRTSSP
ncbi:MAG: EamA family transporter [Chitinivibrionales bacterium]|nr:EamA family transporter [Chitinivibrionales bacterium]